MLTLIALVAAAAAIAVVANWKLQFFRWDLMDEVKKLIQGNTSTGPKVVPESTTVEAAVTDSAARVQTPANPVDTENKPQRARNSRGKFVGDNPATTPVNEAWVGGAAPTKKPVNKPAAKKAPARKPAAKK